MIETFFIILVFCGLIIFSLFMNYNKSEGFDAFTKVHVRLDKDGNALYYSYQQPSGNGELGCTQVPCPSKYNDKYVCWCCCNYH